MESGKNVSNAAETKTEVMIGTKEIGYWKFRKEICTDKGWLLRKTDPQTYDVLDSKRKKIGIFKSQEGFFPNP